MIYSYDDLELLKRNNDNIKSNLKKDKLYTIFVDTVPTFVCRKKAIHNKCINYLNYKSINFDKLYYIECIDNKYKLYSRNRNGITNYDYLETVLEICDGVKTDHI